MTVEKPAPSHRAEVGILFVRTEPSGADVFVDGRFVGKAPVTVAGLSPGQVVVKAIDEGYQEEIPSRIRHSRAFFHIQPQGQSIRSLR